MTRVSLLPRLKAHGITTILERLKEVPPGGKTGIDLLSEYASLKSIAPSGGARADAVAVDVAVELRRIAQRSGFPNTNSQSARSQFDQEAAIYLAQKKELKSGEALRDDVWAFMATVLAPDVVAWRFADNSRERVARFAGGVRNAFQRLWVRGTILDRGDEAPERWELVKQLTEDAMVQIFERASIGGNPPLANAVAECWLRTAEKVGRGPMEDIMRSATKVIRVKNQIIDLAYLSPEELKRVISQIFDIATAAWENSKN
ncbi:hypothetical protein TUM18999_21530 [Pseudomonas tohonis]|uniref:Uncharacterized protein n=1 Tax=Pseudomonas tohonis TaxID=2725477 RepID=A0A6J4E2I1_9PSED|nr:DUF6339 family protein [Pseudomonas tohonis]BCG23962.1 hypothetical protein TUM18999_21530 [Pseudomonas tohonis]